MATIDVEHLRQIKTLPSLIKFLRDELDWPIEVEEIEDITYEYTPEELGLDAKHAAKIKEIKQLRPLETRQPWGIFWVSFEKKRLPMVVLRRILGNLVIKRRAGARKADRPSWQLHDLLFISSYGEEEDRNLSFAHFSEDPETGQLPVLRVLGWDEQDSIMNLDRVANRLSTHLRWPDVPEDVDAWRQQWSDGFTDRYREAIRSADVLIPRLALLAANIRRRVRDVLDAETERGPMRRLFTGVRELLIHDMDEDSFADMYAQTVSYGLLSAAFSRQADIHPQNLVQLTAVSNPFLENLLESLFRLNRGKFHFDIDEVGINDVLDLLRNTNMEAIKAAFSDKNPAEDPVIRFYEGFLKEYDPKQRIRRGIFFTPRPVVSYIVRSVHELLQTEFGLEDGLASTVTWGEMAKRNPDVKIPDGALPSEPFVQILDPAVGTATFLFECIEVIERTMKTKWARELRMPNPDDRSTWRDPEILRRWQDYVPRHLLPRLYGYELMMAPYAIAHLKLALKLGETGYQFREGDRLHIYLTNSLEPPSDLADSTLADLFGPLAREAQQVNNIKRRQRFTVVIGNPPYAQYSMNLTEAAKTHIEKFRYANGQKIRARNALQLERNLNDDYVKFLGFSAELFSPGTGVLGMITNRMFLDSESLVGLREWFSTSFDKCVVVDLWGSTEESRRVARLANDQNVFDILQGVAISFYVRRRGQRQAANPVRWREVVETRELKYALLLSDLDFSDQRWDSTQPQPPMWWLHRSTTQEREHEFTLAEVFPQFSTLIASNRDHLVVGFDPETVLDNVRAVRHFRGSNAELSEQFSITLKSGWNVTAAREKLQALRNLDSFIQVVEYRPFDRRRIFFHPTLVWQTAPVCSNNVLYGKFNRVLISLGKNRAETINGQWVARTLADKSVVSTRDNASGFPLYLYDQEGELNLSSKGEQARRPNLSPEFLKSVGKKLGLPQMPPHGLPKGLTPEDIFHYAYALLHGTEYRRRYAEFLKIDFPRLPLTGSLELFRALAKLGGELVALHLMESPKLDRHITRFVGNDRQLGSRIGGKGKTLEHVKNGKGRVYVNDSSYFDGVPEDVSNFYIGGYQVCHKWLDDRRKAGRSLSDDDITHYHKIVVALNETIRLMAESDKVIEAYGGWPDAFAAKESAKK
jgi:predicted helicase